MKLIKAYHWTFFVASVLSTFVMLAALLMGWNQMGWLVMTIVWIITAVVLAFSVELFYRLRMIKWRDLQSLIESEGYEDEYPDSDR